MAAGTHAAQESDRFAGLRSFWRRPRYAGRDGDRRGVQACGEHEAEDPTDTMNTFMALGGREGVSIQQTGKDRRGERVRVDLGGHCWA